jgi:serine/threonine protein kinase
MPTCHAVTAPHRIWSNSFRRRPAVSPRTCQPLAGKDGHTTERSTAARADRCNRTRNGARGPRARLEREARLLAAVNHPHITAIHGVEESDGVLALVLELVEGETLAERIARGPMSVTDALPLAAQIADALDAAHEKGITTAT